MAAPAARGDIRAFLSQPGRRTGSALPPASSPPAAPLAAAEPFANANPGGHVRRKRAESDAMADEQGELLEAGAAAKRAKASEVIDLLEDIDGV